MVEQTLAEIKARHPRIPSEVLVCDETIVSTALPEIKTKFAARGFTEDEFKAAALDGWKIVRNESPLQTNRCMHSGSFQQLTLNLGRLVFITIPDKAEIGVGGNPLDKQTKFSHWYQPKTLRVKYSKEGYEPVEIDCTVVEGTSTDCYAELKKTN
jgi:hypothetical protein